MVNLLSPAVFEKPGKSHLRYQALAKLCIKLLKS